jgi:hypothetical protein
MILGDELSGVYGERYPVWMEREQRSAFIDRVGFSTSQELPAGPVSAFEDQYALIERAELVGGGQARQTGSHDDNIVRSLTLRIHWTSTVRLE